MTINDHIAAIKEHLKAVEAEKQPKCYLVIPVEADTHKEILGNIEREALDAIIIDPYDTRDCERVYALRRFIRSGKIITVNE